MGKPRLDPKLAEEVMLKAGLKPLEPYTQFRAKWKCLHIACGEIVYPSYASIQGGQGGCKDCGYKIGSAKRKTDETHISKVMANAKLKPLEPYKNDRSKWKCKCLVCKKIVYISFKYVSKTNSGCSYCSKVLVDEVDVVKLMLKAKLKPLVPYKNSKTGWKCKCLVCSKTVFPVYNSIQRGQGGCKYCAGNMANPEKAKELFIKAKLMPLEPYKNAGAKWKSKCMKCNQIVYPSYGNISQGTGGCIYCAEIGFKHKEPAYFYIIFHADFDSIKVGISNENSNQNRLIAFFKDGWQLHYKYDFKIGSDAIKIEKEILRWIREDLELPIHLSLKQMPITGGHTETVSADSITVIEIKKRVDQVIKGLKN